MNIGKSLVRKCITYQPKGGMCAACIRKLDDCSRFEFDKMRAHEANDSVIIVICSAFKKE
jgi:hypothetical protein